MGSAVPRRKRAVPVDRPDQSHEVRYRNAECSPGFERDGGTVSESAVEDFEMHIYV